MDLARSCLSAAALEELAADLPQLASLDPGEPGERERLNSEAAFFSSSDEEIANVPVSPSRTGYRVTLESARQELDEGLDAAEGLLETGVVACGRVGVGV